MATGTKMPASLFVCCLGLLSLSSIVSGQVLTPEFFNLAQGRNITATATCGEGVSHPELFCRLTGLSNVDALVASGNWVINQGQICDYCDPSIPEKYHPIENAIDGTEKWWQSPPLSRQQDLNKVNVTVSLGQEFHVAYVIIKSANSPNPGVWVLERSKDFGKTWQPWQYFADTPSDCINFFNTRANQPLQADDQVLCTTVFSQVPPLSNGEIMVSLVNGRPNANNFSYALDLQEWTKATDIQIRLIRTKTLLAHLMDVARQDPSVTRRYYYSIKDISIGGRCVCNGHAARCDVRDPYTQRLICRCEANTCGEQCETCCPGFTQKRWRRALKEQPFACEPCNCHGHSDECEFDEEVERKRLSLDIHGNYEGGGVCKNCKNNTQGINCEMCVPGFYRPHNHTMDMENACQPCQCDLTFSSGECEDGTGRCLCRKEFTGPNCDECNFGYYDYPYCKPCECFVNGTEGSLCTVDRGVCPCKENFAGAKCDQCASGYYNFPECVRCECDRIGSQGNVCDAENGQCPCSFNYGGRDCGECAAGYYNYSVCDLCNCDPSGTEEQICDPFNGACMCKDNYTSSRCDRCVDGFFNFPNCEECNCASPGSMSAMCASNGQCRCAANFGGRACDRCAPGYYKYPDCTPCNCDVYGSQDQSCDQISGQCRCLSNFVGIMCDKCRADLYNYPQCEECNCNPDGAKDVTGYPRGGCGLVTVGRLCECKERVLGRICDQCQPGYWNLNRNNPEGCQECTCNEAGTLSGLNKCDMETGQCVCKPYVGGRDCDRCRDGFYNLQARNPFGCVGCRCNIGGSRRDVCDKKTGQCPCKDRITGQRCDQPMPGHFIPDLHQNKFEFEEGMTPEGARIRYGYDDRVFPDFSWRGYAILTPYQPEVELEFDIRIPSVYRIIYRYVNREDTPTKATVTLTPTSLADVKQTGEITFLPTQEPKFAVVTSENNAGYVLNPGHWVISTNVPNNMFLDYFVLIPQSFYEATHLEEKITDPCLALEDAGPCVSFKYPDLNKENFTGGYGILGYDNEGNKIGFNPDMNLTTELGSQGLAQLNETQKSFKLDLQVPWPDKYMIVVNFHNPLPVSQDVDIDVTTPDNKTYVAMVTLPSCPYSSLCRQVVKGPDGLAGIFDIATSYATLTFTASDNNDENNLSIDSVYAIPMSKWKPDYGLPRIICIKVNGVCALSTYGRPVGTVLIQFESSPNEHLVSTSLPRQIWDPNTRLVNLNDSHVLIKQTDCPLSNTDASQNCTTELIVQQKPLELLGQVSKPGAYILVVHYYMPTEIKHNIPVTVYVDEKALTGMFTPHFCPSTVGCRAAIRFDQSGSNQLRMQGPDLRVLFEGTHGKDIWLDYLLVIPVGQFSNDYLDVQPIVKSNLFITQCVDEGFTLNTTNPFCQVGAFTLTTNFNNGALDCDCSPDGSLSFTCNGVGGACRCKENVIGRQCTACAQDYYGFPNCKPCNCQFGLCHEQTGECICPPHVEGDQCDRCKSGAYGYDPLIGCQLCNCNAEGTVNGDQSCDQLTGQCNCKDNVGGRRCELCLPGFSDYPYCDDCGCDTAGTTDEICDQRNAQCLCKQNVRGTYCDQCADGMFSLTPDNPLGCIECFCFERTTKCSSAGLSWEMISDMKGWNITSLADDAVNVTMVDYGTTLVVENRDGVLEDPDLYWLAPSTYTGKKLNAYGGKLEFTVLFALPREGETSGIVKEDIILTGGNMTVVHFHNSQPSANYPFKFEVELREYNFRHSGNNAPVSRSQFMRLLAQMDSLVIRASYYSRMSQIRLKEVTMQVASEQGTGQLAESVEQCECPPNYIGMSCEQCAPGAYRIKTPTPSCVSCNCNGHSNECDVNTGECYNCRDNTTGPHCEQCLAGYYGDPYTGACSICSCPMPLPSNNFATSCSVSSEGYTDYCYCQPGYTGALCDECAPGYYGNPLIVGDFCQPCSCNGNIDVRNPDSCDRFTGACLLCDNNSAGLFCGQCREWFWGDAVVEKNCQACTCDRCGSESCDNIRGVCQCKKNVVGISCDQCAPNTWGFDYCGGCNDCNCGIGSVSGQCDDRTGRCECQPGVEGEKCDRCMPGHWNYGPAGCQECDCSGDGATGCDPDTGRCTCLPGVGGEKCDRCLPRWVLVPNRGCQECDYCIHLLIDDLDVMASKVTEVSRTLGDVSIGVGAFNKLSYYNNTVDTLRPEVTDLLNMDTGKFIKSLAMIAAGLDNITKDAREVLEQSNSLAFEADELPKNLESLKTDVNNADKMVREVEVLASDVVRYIQEVYRRLESGTVGSIDSYISGGEQFVKDMEEKDFSGKNASVQAELDDAEDAMEQVQDLNRNATASLNSTEAIDKQLEDLESRLQDLINSTRYAQGNADSATAIIRRLTAVQLEILSEILKKVKAFTAEREDKLEEANKLLDEAEQMMAEADMNVKEIESESSRLDSAVPTLEDHIVDVGGQMDMLLEITNQSQIHANALADQAAELERVYGSTRNRSEDPVKAGQAYQNIEMGIADARSSADEAVDDANTAKTESDGISANVNDALYDSEALLMEAKNLLKQTEEDLKKELEQSEEGVETWTEESAAVRETYDQLMDDIKKLNESSQSNMSSAVIEQVKKTEATLNKSLKLSQPIVDKTPDMNDKDTYIAANAPKAADDMRQAKEGLESVAKSRPEVASLVESVSKTTERVTEKSRNLGINIDALKEKIAQARDTANRIKVGLKFTGNTTLTLRNPPSLKDTGSFSTASMYLKTFESDALLMYLGNNQNVADGSRAKRSVDALISDVMDSDADALLSRQARQVPDFQSDYLALELRNGRVVFTVNLGSGAVHIPSNKRVDDGQWHQIVAERIGKSAKLIVKTDKEEDDVVEGTTQGTFTVLELNPITTHALIGSVPQDFQLPRGLTTRPFIGGIEDVMFDGKRMGLWNFVKGENNNKGIMQRDVMQQEFFYEGARFNGQGYVVLGKEFLRMAADRTVVEMSFKTYVQDGLLFYMSKNDYFGVWMQDGRVHAKYDLGGGSVDQKSNKTYNDGQWHKLIIDRVKRTCSMSIDANEQETIDLVESPGNLNNLETTDDIFIGGIDVSSAGGFSTIRNEVINTGLDGCIKDLSINRNGIDIFDNLRGKGVVKGCVPKVIHVVTFPSSAMGYMSLAPVSVGGMFDLTFKVKTTKENALLMLASDESQSNVFSVSVSKGKIVVSEQLGAITLQLPSKVNTYGDGEWHYVSIMKMGGRISMSIDDTEMVEAESVPGDLLTDSPLYFGGVPATRSITAESVLSTESIAGCMGDITINKKFQNLASRHESFGITLDECNLEAEPEVTEKPIVPPKEVEPNQCSLPQVASTEEGETTKVEGVRFGTSLYSRNEYQKLPVRIKVRSVKISLKFRTTGDSGVMFYVAGSKHWDFLGIFMIDGKVNYGFNCGSGPARIVSPRAYNDGQWHTLTASRSQTDGLLNIDGQNVAEGRSNGRTRSLNVKAPYYVGGIRKDVKNMALKNLKEGYNSFPGCIDQITVNMMKLEAPLKEIGSQPCSDNVETGSFIGADGGYVTLSDKFNVGKNLEIVMQVRPRSQEGVLLAVHSSKNDYLVLQMSEGAIIFTIDNGAGAITVKSEPIAKNALCDGQWHFIIAEKMGNALKLTVDDVTVENMDSGNPKVTSADTSNPLYVGGIKDQTAKGIVANGYYTGCVRNVRLNNKLLPVTDGTPVGDVRLDVCPAR